MSHLQKAGRRHTRTHAEHARARAHVAFLSARPGRALVAVRAAFRRRGLQMIISIHILKNGGKEFRTRSARPAPRNRRRPGAWGNRFAPGRTRQLVQKQISCGTTGYRSGYDVWLLVPWQVQFIMESHGHDGFASIRLKKAMESVVRPTALGHQLPLATRARPGRAARPPGRRPCSGGAPRGGAGGVGRARRARQCSTRARSLPARGGGGEACCSGGA